MPWKRTCAGERENETGDGLPRGAGVDGRIVRAPRRESAGRLQMGEAVQRTRRRWPEGPVSRASQHTEQVGAGDRGGAGEGKEGASAMGTQETRRMARCKASGPELASTRVRRRVGSTATGLVERGRSRRAVEPYTEPFAKVEEPNDLWCADFKGQFKTLDEKYCYPLTITDADSRYLLTCRGMYKTKFEDVQPWFENAFDEFGVPACDSDGQ